MVSSGRALASDDAQSLFDQGLGEMKAGRYKLGCALIKRSLDVDARPGTLFTLAECYSRAGRYASAVANYDRFIAIYESMPPDQQEQQHARAELSRSERNRLVTQVAWLTVTLPLDAPSNVTVTLDGEELAPNLFGIATAVDPGPHVFTMHAPDGPLIEQRVDVEPGERKSTMLQVHAAPAAAPTEGDIPATEPQEPEEPPSGDTEPPAKKSITPWVYVTGGIGAAGIVTGTVTGLMLLDKRSTIKSECNSRPDANGQIACTQAGKDAADVAQHTLAPITTIALGVGAAGALATILLIVADGGKTAHPSAHRMIPLVGFSDKGANVGVETTW